MNLHNAQFIKSVTNFEQFFTPELPEIVFAGRSNVGKSSVINCLLNRKSFARTSGTPGKTAQINYFKIDNKVYFVDLPGYGYAKVSNKEKERWGYLIEEYFRVTDTIKLGILIVDIRHKPTADDIQMSKFFKNSKTDYIIIANKLDKIKPSQIEERIKEIVDTLKPGSSVKVFPFTAEKGDGKKEVLEEIIKRVQENEILQNTD